MSVDQNPEKNRGEMSVREAGRLGGRSNYEKYGREHYRDMARKSVAKLLKERGSEHFKRIGTAGGKSTAKKFEASQRSQELRETTRE